VRTRYTPRAERTEPCQRTGLPHPDPLSGELWKHCAGTDPPFVEDTRVQTVRRSTRLKMALGVGMLPHSNLLHRTAPVHSPPAVSADIDHIRQWITGVPSQSALDTAIAPTFRPWLGPSVLPVTADRPSGSPTTCQERVGDRPSLCLATAIEREVRLPTGDLYKEGLEPQACHIVG
jgi:hypothetical protein